MPAVNRVLGECADPQIDVVDVRVYGCQGGLDIRVGADFSKAHLRRQGQSLAAIVVAGQAVVASALDIHRSEVEAAVGFVKEEITDFVDHQGIDVLRSLG